MKITHEKKITHEPPPNWDLWKLLRFSTQEVKHFIHFLPTFLLLSTGKRLRSETELVSPIPLIEFLIWHPDPGIELVDNALMFHFVIASSPRYINISGNRTLISTDVRVSWDTYTSRKPLPQSKLQNIQQYILCFCVWRSVKRFSDNVICLFICLQSDVYIIM